MQLDTRHAKNAVDGRHPTCTAQSPSYFVRICDCSQNTDCSNLNDFSLLQRRLGNCSTCRHLSLRPSRYKNIQVSERVSHTLSLDQRLPEYQSPLITNIRDMITVLYIIHDIPQCGFRLTPRREYQSRRHASHCSCAERSRRPKRT